MGDTLSGITLFHLTSSLLFGIVEKITNNREDDMELEERRQVVKELMEQRAKLNEELYRLNPFIELNDMKNKEFGEWSERYILDRVPNLEKGNGKGKDLRSKKLGKIEVKSTRCPNKFTLNQIKPEYSNYHLIVLYDIDNIDVALYLIPNDVIMSDMSTSRQHNYTGPGNCFVARSTKNNRRVLEQHRVTFEELNDKV